MNLTDVNDNSPEFPAPQSLNIEENRVMGSTITRVTATDADEGINAALIYRIVDGDILGNSRVRDPPNLY